MTLKTMDVTLRWPFYTISPPPMSLEAELQLTDLMNVTIHSVSLKSPI